jgi:hypothetical protein
MPTSEGILSIYLRMRSSNELGSAVARASIHRLSLTAFEPLPAGLRLGSETLITLMKR